MLKQFRTRSEDGVDPRTWGKSGEKRRGWRQDAEKISGRQEKGNGGEHTGAFGVLFRLVSSFLRLFRFLRLLVLSTLRRERESENGECEDRRIGCSALRALT